MSDPRDVSVYNLLFRTVCELVDQPKLLIIETLAEHGNVTFTIHTHPDDTENLIGQNAHSLRIIFSGIGMKLHRRYVINVDGESLDSDG